MYEKREIIGFHKLSAGRDWTYLDSDSSEGGKERRKIRLQTKIIMLQTYHVQVSISVEMMSMEDDQNGSPTILPSKTVVST